VIALVVAAEAAAALPFAPPIGLSIPYRTVSIRPARSGGTVRVALDERLRFDEGTDGLEASATADSSTVDAPPAIRPVLLALFAAGDGLRTRARIGPDGQVLGILDGAGSWAAIAASHRAAKTRLADDPDLSPADKARLGASFDQVLGLDAAARDAKLADALAALLPPPLPALRLGETRRFTATMAGPTGPLTSTGTVAFVGMDAGACRYRIETRTDPPATRAAADALVATLARATPEDRARSTAQAAALHDLAYAETMDVTVERSTGLLVRSRLVRRTVDGQGREEVVEENETTRLTPTVP
jgi:hypothetical protein